MPCYHLAQVQMLCYVMLHSKKSFYGLLFYHQYTTVQVCIHCRSKKCFLNSYQLYDTRENAVFSPFHSLSNVPFSNIFVKCLSQHWWHQPVCYLVFWRCRHNGTFLLITCRPSLVKVKCSLTNLRISGGDRKQTSPVLISYSQFLCARAAFWAAIRRLPNVRC